MATRIRNWKVHLVKWAKSNIGKDFKWGETDCGSLTMKACGVMYHANLFPHVGDYTSLRSAREVFNQLESFEDALSQAGAAPIPRTYVTAGDFVVGEEEEHGFPTSHVVLPRCVLSSDPEEGVFRFNRSLLDDEMTVYRFPGEVE